MSGAKGTPVVEVKDLNISFKTAAGVIKVVENVSFSIGKGECLAVVGESGSGKSVSALATIGLLVKDQSIVTGSVFFRGEELLGKPESYMRKIRGGGISMIFQEPLSALNPVTTIGEQIAEVLVAHVVPAGVRRTRRRLNILSSWRSPRHRSASSSTHINFLAGCDSAR